MLLYPFKHREGGGGLEWINIGGICLSNYVVFCSLSFFDTSLRLSFVNNDRNRSVSSSNILGNFCLFLVIIIFHTLTAQILTIFLISGINWMKRLNTWPPNLKQGIWESHFTARDPPKAQNESYPWQNYFCQAWQKRARIVPAFGWIPCHKMTFGGHLLSSFSGNLEFKNIVINLL